MRFSHKTTEPIEELDGDFSDFRWQEIVKNRITIGLEIERLWNKRMKGGFPPTGLTGAVSKTHSEKLRAMKDHYKIEERVIQDFDLLDGLTKDIPRSGSIQAFEKSEALKAYLSKLSPTLWKTLTSLFMLNHPVPRDPVAS